ncbi:MAG: hypothetical protein D8M57_02795 [Candidatus Scalindua sp. AMX11]|nr:MAG: hypothetical protein DWQ00_17195 [Candidatus Scalindua sp.]NOG85791.1 hypothetical protein [Planctomycetota bacterium]RZV97033.1 MAG: hypothetical protein EX341_02265 [Candidatus Scalindua sp. SCAELEC01]TDE66353.1 MAG: hypothetical protein D8M57_02795 [Candidatus Scalindua sp. AMX11]GJQ58255.1 MAG: hypothetical protein SCALA701_10560 [Candidatus Scalindua sp.]
MTKRNLTILSCSWSIYIGIFAFFFACILGYFSHVPIDTVVKKAIIAGSLLGVMFFLSIKYLVNMIPDVTHVVKQDVNGSDKDSQDEVF